MLEKITKRHPESQHFPCGIRYPVSSIQYRVSSIRKTTLFQLLLITVMVIFSGFVRPLLAAADEVRLIDLRGQWRFEIGDNPRWADPEFDDSAWESIFVPGTWEDEGFHGYDGFAWYRKSFPLQRADSGNPIYLHMGRIDDVDEVYVNGRLVGATGRFPPNVVTGHNLMRNYWIPAEYLNFSGENLIAVRIYDQHLEGGILEGRIGLYEIVAEAVPEILLTGLWKFRPGDQPRWKEPDINDSDWEDILVPAKWDVQGYQEYDGFAWYRKTCLIPERMRGEALVLLLGLIDDLDETYLNGYLIGRTGRMNQGTPQVYGDEWTTLRAYPIPAEYIRFGRENTFAVRVYDGEFDGGMYSGIVGIISRERYEKWQASEKESSPFWKYFDAFFK